MDRAARCPGDLLDPVAGDPRSGLAYLFVFRLFAAWGATRTTLVAYVIPVVGIVLGYLVLAEPVDARILFGTAVVIAGIGLVNSRFGRRRLFGRVPPVGYLTVADGSAERPWDDAATTTTTRRRRPEIRRPGDDNPKYQVH